MSLVEHTWAVLAGVFIAPFVQEDAAVFGAAGLAAMGVAPTAVIFGVALAGLTASDVWKYWAGRLAGKHAWARKIAEKPAALAAKERIVKHLAASMFVARFVPGTRVPLYVAAGVFRAPFLLFFIYVAASGALYLALAFALVRALGEIAGEEAAGRLPFVVVGLALLYIGFLAFRRWRAKRRAGAEAPAAETAALDASPERPAA